MRPRAVTLLELVVVMAILMILVAIFAPATYHFIRFVRHLGQP